MKHSRVAAVSDDGKGCRAIGFKGNDRKGHLKGQARQCPYRSQLVTAVVNDDGKAPLIGAWSKSQRIFIRLSRFLFRSRRNRLFLFYRVIPNGSLLLFFFNFFNFSFSISLRSFLRTFSISSLTVWGRTSFTVLADGFRQRFFNHIGPSQIGIIFFMRRKKHPKTNNDKRITNIKHPPCLFLRRRGERAAACRLGLRGIAFSLMPEDGFYHRWP